MITRQVTLATLLLASLTACADRESRWAGSISDSAGVTIVSNPDVGIWTVADQWTVEEELRIGAREGDPQYQFGEIGGITVDSRGRVFVLDTQAQQIKVYSAAGVYEHTLGARGSGPGEMRGATSVLMGAGDTLVVPDLQNLRLTRYGPDGVSLPSSPIDVQQGPGLLFQATPSGVLVGQTRQSTYQGQAEIEDPHDAIVTFAVNGTILDTLLTFPSGGMFSTSRVTMERKIFSVEPVWAYGDESGLIYARNNEYRISQHSANGELVRVITKPFERVPVSERDREEFLGFLERDLSAAGVPAQTIVRFTSGISFGEFLPAFANVTTGPGGTIWVQHVQAPSELSEEERENHTPGQTGAMGFFGISGAADWDVFDYAGQYLGVVTMPARFSLHSIRGDKIYGVWRDDSDVQYLVRLGIVGDVNGRAG